MALSKNSKNKIISIFPGFGSGKYFIFYAFVFLFSCTILSLQLENILIWSISISLCIIGIGFISKNPTISFGSVLPMVAGLLIYTDIQYLYNQQNQVQQLITGSTHISATIVDLGSSKKGKQRATLELSNGNIVYSYIPSHYSILLGREIQLEQPIFLSGGLMQLSRGSMGELKYSSFSLGEIASDYYLLVFKSNIIERIRKIFPPPESALLTGILIGDDSLMDEDFTNLYRSIGLSHITVVSGSNIAAVLAILYILLNSFTLHIRVIFSLLGVGMYVLMVGTDPPVLRALFMGSISLLALTYGERVDALRILLCTAIVLVIISPLSLIYDAGFQLSFLATLGILVSLRLFKKRSVIIQAIGVSIFAGIWTLPISIGTFGSFHLWSIPANILVGPAVEASMMMGGLVVFLDTIYSPLGYMVGYIPYFTLLWIQKIAEVFSQLPLQVQFSEEIQPAIAFLVFGITIGFSLRYLHLPNPSDESYVPSDQ